ncbi:MAG TPA: ChaB family protein [Frankiaceae bacterium]|nr:ChaB family protein [Frankiaceae bacterium]
MPPKKKSGPDPDDLPAPVARSDEKAQRTFAETHDSAIETRNHEGDEQYAHRVAYSALKHSYEKVGDHWEPKDEKGPSDAQAETTGPQQNRETRGGVDENASKKHLQELARKLDISGRSTMDKDELAKAIDKANQKANAQARS